MSARHGVADTGEFRQREGVAATKKIRKRVLRYLSLPPTRHDLTQGQKPEGQLKWG